MVREAWASSVGHKIKDMPLTTMLRYANSNKIKDMSLTLFCFERQVLKYASDDSRVVREAAVGVIATVALKGPFSSLFFFITLKPRVQ